MSSITQLQGSTPITTAGAAAIINNNFNALNSEKIETSVIDVDTTLSANSDSKIPSQKAVKAYIDAGGSTEVPQQFVNTSSGVADAGKGVETNASGLVDSTFFQIAGFGDGSDSDVTISSGTTTLTRDMYYNNLTVNGTGILKTGGFRIFVKNLLTVDSSSGASINNDGGAGGNGGSPTAGSAGAASAAGFFQGGVAGVIGGAGSNGAANGSVGTNGNASGVYALNNNAGVAGGKGGNDTFTGGNGGTGGAISSASTQLPRGFNGFFGFEMVGTGAVTITKQNVSASGGSGGGGAATTGKGGGGGGSGGTGGVVCIFAKRLFITGTGCISANGGAGGNGGNETSQGGGGGGGAGGNGGIVILGYTSKIGTGSATANGGAKGVKGSGVNNGVDGTDGINGLVIELY